MVRRVLMGFLAGVFLCPAADSFAFEVPLKYVRHPKKREGFLPYGQGSVQKSLDRPDGDWKLPSLKADQPIYGILSVGDKRRLMVLDRMRETDAFYNRLYFDANGNRDLTDDPVIDGLAKVDEEGGTILLWGSSSSRSIQRTRHYRTVFPAVDLQVEVAGKSLPYSLLPEVYYSTTESAVHIGPEELAERFHFIYDVTCSYTGDFKLGGKQYSVALGDTDGNGRFGEPYTLPKLSELAPGEPIPLRGDRIYLAEKDQITYSDGFVWGDRLVFDDRVYTIGLSAGLEALILEPVTEGLARLSFATDVKRMTLWNEATARCVIMYRPEKEVRFPPGDYRLLVYQARRKELQGDLWHLEAQGTRDGPVTRVGRSERAVLRFGEPFRPMVEVPGWAGGERESRSQVRLALRVEGEAREVVRDIRHIKGERSRIARSRSRKSRPKEPEYRILNSSGDTVARGKFEYG